MQLFNCTELLISLNKSQIRARELLDFRQCEGRCALASQLCFLWAGNTTTDLLPVLVVQLPRIPVKVSLVNQNYPSRSSLATGLPLSKWSYAMSMWGAVQDSDPQQRDGAVWLGAVISFTGTAGTGSGMFTSLLGFCSNFFSIDPPKWSASILHFYWAKTLSSCFHELTCGRS